QVDFFQPENFDLNYVTPQGTYERPVVIHQAIYGSIERFFGILLEHFKGDLPFWIAPIQAKILTITDEQKEYAEKVSKQLLESGIRIQTNETSDPINAKIKSAQGERIPWMLIIGKKEVENNTVSLRTLDGKQENGIPLDQLIEKAKELNKF
ncbi:His/Gly/Thr/Pro-type tRNA ligase C-terminal domain-containing protein, partial [Listeria monocytogenes]|uniref:His/Gly/Thr/Pro-type tRNA ligase C-terminal domain-containing protein n=1 Tax=Listeria monocytogenes TaxID=1639 RepID=UPI003AB4A53A